MKCLLTAMLLVGCTGARPPPEPAATPAEDHCTKAREGQPCAEGAGYCVLDWGEPGGHSTALWCRQGTWQLEREANLPLDPG